MGRACSGCGGCKQMSFEIFVICFPQHVGISLFSSMVAVRLHERH
jgi:hypothetical protein